LAIEVCSTAFSGLARSQAKALGYPDLPLAVVRHPFGSLSRAEIRREAEECVEKISIFAKQAPKDHAQQPGGGAEAERFIAVADDAESVNLLFRERRWTDGLPIVPPTRERVVRMLSGSGYLPGEVIARVAPAFGEATVESIAVNAVMAGCDTGYLPVLIAAVEAMCAPEFNLQGIQTTTNPSAVWLLVNGPIVSRLGMNSGINCLGQGNWANATLGRALHLVMQNIGGAVGGEMDRATMGQPGKYLFCCAENEAENPWQPVHVERGFSADDSVVTVIGAEGSLNLNTHSKDALEILRIFAETLVRPSGNDYFLCGEPWLIISPETANILSGAGLAKDDVKRSVWAQSKLPAWRLTDVDLNLTRIRRIAELGEVTQDTMLPIATAAGSIGIVVCGGPGTHSMYIPSFGNTRSVSRKVRLNPCQTEP
jgi:hypothetical protein